MSKIQVAHYIFSDMKEYYKNVDDSLYEINYEGVTDPELIVVLRNYCSGHLPIPLYAWLRVNIPDSNLLYRDKFAAQTTFLEYHIMPLLFKKTDDQLKNPILVISTHRSKSVLLPVYQIKTCFATFILRNNFYNWKVSVDSEVPLYFDTMDLFDINEDVPEVYCEGFPNGLVFTSFSKSNKKFTFEVRDDYELYTFFYLLRNYLKSLKLRYDYNEEIRAYIKEL